jgi:single-stranded-DNA-specific exonuclease
MNKTWLDPQETSVPENLRKVVGGHPLVAETLTRRGICKPDTVRAFLDPGEYTPTPANEMPGLNRAADLIEAAIDQREHILVWGDFDVDGQTATTLLVEALLSLGAEVSYYIPIRATESHGIKIEALKKQLSAPHATQPALLLTCDTGISEHEAVDYAKSQGLTVIITDHHDLPSTLPNADAIVNSKLLPEGHPLSTLPGVGVAYKLVEELLDRVRQTSDRDRGAAASKLKAESLLDLVALGIVADIALQVGDARYLLQRGLEVLRRTPRLGLQALFRNANIIPDQISEEQIGFGIGPRLNALGRLSDANPIVEFFTTHNPSQANILATHLEGLNSKRRLLTDQIYKAAISQIERQPELLQFAALVLAHPQWPAGVIGIVASRLVEEFNKPTILLSTPEGEAGRGSARSIEGLHITEAIAAQSEMLHGFGGHPMAAGLSLDSERVPDFRHALSRTIRQMIGPTAPEPTLPIDAYIDLDELGLDLVDDLRRLAPFGAGNPALILATRDLHLVSQTTIGRDQKHLRLVVADQHGHNQDVIWWRGTGQPLPNGEFDLAYTIQANTFRGQRGLQVIWQDSRQSEATTPEVEIVSPALEIVDYRDEEYPLPLWDQIKTQENILIFTEGDAKRRFPSGGCDRTQLAPAEKLVLWTTPPSPNQFSKILKAVNPSQVYLFTIDPQLDQPEPFLERLAGLVKHILNTRQGRVDLRTLAAAMAHRETTLRAGLSWMEEKGLIRVEWSGESGKVQITPGGDPGLALEDMAMVLKAMLDESAAYRAYLKTVDSEALFI